jgi:hypothetical protein
MLLQAKPGSLRKQMNAVKKQSNSTVVFNVKGLNIYESVNYGCGSNAVVQLMGHSSP